MWGISERTFTCMMVRYFIIREFVFTRTEIIKDIYAYHYQDANGRMIFRYDNTQHFRNLPTFPHHKHTSDRVLPAPEPDLQAILNEVLGLLDQSGRK